MARPRCCRQITGLPACRMFVPQGGNDQEAVVLAADEFEALRLADAEGLYQEEAARRMGVSRQTFGRIVEAARRKVAQALVAGHPLRIDDAPTPSLLPGRHSCAACGQAWKLSTLPAHDQPVACPHCRKTVRGCASPACRRNSTP